jgi:pimeloyl-ACP methyl ester carboxylesterase
MYESLPPVRKITIGDNELACKVKEGGNQCLLFVHGLGCSKETFRNAFEGSFFSTEYTLVAPDLLGHGESSKPKEFSYALEEQANVLVQLLRGLKYQKLSIIAHSMGGVIALLLIEELKKVNAFFCLEGNLSPEDCTMSLRVSLLEEKDFLNKFFPLAPLNFRCRGLASDPITNFSFNEFLLERYTALPVKKVYIYGEESREKPILKKLGDLETVQIDKCGHFMMMDNPESTYKEIARRL